MNISDYLRTATLNHVLGVATYTPPTTIYAALYTASPTSAGGGTEVSSAGYARVSTTWGTAVLGQAQNSSLIRFPASGNTTSNWGTVNTLCLLDAVTAGNLLFYGPLSVPVVLSIGNFFTIAVNGLTITFQ